VENELASLEENLLSGKDSVLLRILPEAAPRLYFLAGAVYTASHMGSWLFLPDGELTTNSFPSLNEFLTVFRMNGCLDYAIQTIRESPAPILLIDPLHISWIIDYVKPINGIVVLGPGIDSDTTLRELEDKLRMLDETDERFGTISEKARLLPVMSREGFFQYAKMLHYAIGGELLESEQIRVENMRRTNKAADIEDRTTSHMGYDRILSAEKRLAQVIREGNMHSRSVVALAVSYVVSTDRQFRENQRIVKDRAVSMLNQCARAAVEGGLSAKIALQMEEQFVRQIERAESNQTLIDFFLEAMRAYTEAVYWCRKHPVVSNEIQNCLKYINTHIREPLKLEQIAEETGYSTYYLTRKFQREMGMRILDYIRDARIEQAKIMLMNGTPIQRISDELQFNTRRYFTKVFKDSVGLSPAKYRQQHGKTEEK